MPWPNLTPDIDWEWCINSNNHDLCVNSLINLDQDVFCVTRQWRRNSHQISLLWFGRCSLCYFVRCLIDLKPIQNHSIVPDLIHLLDKPVDERVDIGERMVGDGGLLADGGGNRTFRSTLILLKWVVLHWIYQKKFLRIMIQDVTFWKQKITFTRKMLKKMLQRRDKQRESRDAPERELVDENVQKHLENILTEPPWVLGED